jgi:glyoxylase-like metal-dependent hydrolase (beta-lactamase superfamily II)
MNYHFKIGRFKCVTVSDGEMTYAPPAFPPPPVFLFADAERAKLARVLSGYGINVAEWREWVSSYTCLLIDTGQSRILVDTGAGSLASGTGKLLENLRQEGVSPDDIHLVILSHGHPDHVGGNLDGAGKPVFTRARWMISKAEWQFWTVDRGEPGPDEHGRGMLIDIARKNLLPLQGRIDLIENEGEILPGVKLVFAPGHTPGQMAIDLESEGERLLFLADVVIHPVHVEHPEWPAATDVSPEQVVKNRRRLLGKAAGEKSLVMAFHFPFPGLGRVHPKGESWQWEPVEKH